MAGLRTAIVRASAAGLAILALCGCSVSDRYVMRGADSSDAEMETSDATPTFGESACGLCVFASCDKEVKNCKADAACAPYLDCIDACETGASGAVDQACAGRCLNASAGGSSSTISALSTCMTSGPGASCAACGGGDAGLGAILHEKCATDPDASNECDECFSEKCCETGNACKSDPSCIALANCESHCVNGLPDEAGASAEPPDGGGYSCDLWCSASTNPGADKWVQFLACTDILCTGGPACGGANSCSVCVDQYCQNAELTITATVDGYLFGKCTLQCATGDSECLTQCANIYPDVQMAAIEFESCAMQHCPGCQ
jgi:hypothetical protein